MPLLPADFTHARPCKPFCEKFLTLPRNQLSLPRVAGSFFYGGAGVDAYSLTMTFFCRHEKSAPAKRRMRIIRLFYQKKKIKENYRRKLSNEKGDLLCNEHFSTPIFTIIITIVLFKYPPSSIILFF